MANREEIKAIRWREDEWELVEQAAAREGIEPSKLIRRLTLTAIRSANAMGAELVPDRAKQGSLL